MFTLSDSINIFCCSVAQVVSDSLPPHELQHTRLPYPSLSPRVCSNLCPLSRWCHPNFSSSVAPFSSCPQFFQHQGLFQWVGSSHQVAKVLALQLQRQSFIEYSGLISFRIDWFVWITTNCGKFLEKWEYQTTLPATWETCVQVKKQQLELDMEQQTGSKLGKEYIKAVYCHSAYLTSMQSTSCEMRG